VRYRIRHTQCGFTLIELLVVIGIVAVLLSILMPSLSRARVAAKRVRCAYNLKQIYTAVCLYTQVHNETYPCAQDPLSTSPSTVWLWMGRGWRRFVESHLGGPIDGNNPSVLFCPEEQIDSMSVAADTYKNARPSMPQRTINVARAANKILIGEWQSNHARIVGDDPGWWGWKGARNFLSADGQVRFLDANDVLPARDGNPNPCLTVNGIKGKDWGP
jgi:prepilin-type N-terminal cleavage/methylation domain-containing protein